MEDTGLPVNPSSLPEGFQGTGQQPDAAFLMQGLAHLRDRSKSLFKNAHVLIAGADYWSLDLDIHADSPESLRAAIEQRLSTIEESDILQGAPPADWKRFVDATVANWQQTQVLQTVCVGAKFGRLRLVMVPA